MSDPVKLVKNEPCDEVIDHLESLLEDAKAGNLRAIAYAGTYTEGRTGSGWCGVSDEPGRGTTLAGELGVLRARIENQILRKYFAEEISP